MNQKEDYPGNEHAPKDPVGNAPNSIRPLLVSEEKGQPHHPAPANKPKQPGDNRFRAAAAIGRGHPWTVGEDGVIIADRRSGTADLPNTQSCCNFATKTGLDLSYRSERKSKS